MEKLTYQSLTTRQARPPIVPAVARVDQSCNSRKGLFVPRSSSAVSSLLGLFWSPHELATETLCLEHGSTDEGRIPRQCPRLSSHHLLIVWPIASG